MDLRGTYYNTKHQVRDLEDLLYKLPRSESTETPGSLRKPRELPRRIKRRSPDEETELISAYSAGATIYELADRFEIDRKTVSRILHRHHVPMRRRGLTPTQVDEAIRLHAAGWTLKRMCTTLPLLPIANPNFKHCERTPGRQ